MESRFRNNLNRFLCKVGIHDFLIKKYKRVEQEEDPLCNIPRIYTESRCTRCFKRRNIMIEVSKSEWSDLKRGWHINSL